MCAPRDIHVNGGGREGGATCSHYSEEQEVNDVTGGCGAGGDVCAEEEAGCDEGSEEEGAQHPRGGHAVSEGDGGAAVR